MDKLVIVESPSKEKSIKKYLGDGYQVKASRGHVVDLPKKELGVDIEKSYQPKYIVTNKKSLKALRDAFSGKDGLILAVDPDREGEAIGWHVAMKLGVLSKGGKIKKGKTLERIVFSEITEDAVKSAIRKPRSIDYDLVNAQQTRRILDRLVGYKLSPLLWKKVRFGLSAGRVQSVALKIVVDKEAEIDKFDPKEYWSVESNVSQEKVKTEFILNKQKDDKDDKEEKENKYLFVLTKYQNKAIEIKDEEQVESLKKYLMSNEWIISGIETKLTSRNPLPPFKTSTLQQFASNRYNFSAKRTMVAAQKLYEAGLISYMRTDSLNLSKQAVDSARGYIRKAFGEKYLSKTSRNYKTSSKVAQEAHEAIRPTNFAIRAEEVRLGKDEIKLYDMIWRQTLSTQAAQAKIERVNVSIKVGDYIFQAISSKVVFDGFMKISGSIIKESKLPLFENGQIVYPKTICASQKFTTPPARYSEATLIKMLEKYGIGRPSTYAAIISTIISRKYVEKEGRSLVPTDTGKVVTHLLEDHFPDIVDYNFTAKWEDLLDNIANGQANWQKVIDDFYKPFEKAISSKEKNIEREDYNILAKAPDDIKCPECKGPMVVKLGKYGRFYSCAKWPKCKGMLSADGKTKEQVQNESKSDMFVKNYKPAPKTNDGRDYLLKQGRYGLFWAHPDYPKIKDARAIEYNDQIHEKVYGKAPKAKDGKVMVFRIGKFGPYWAHPKYPKVKEVQRIDKKRVKEIKDSLGLPY